MINEICDCPLGFLVLFIILVKPVKCCNHGSYGHGKSWNFSKSWKIMEKSWNFIHLFSEKNSWAPKINKTDGKSRIWQKCNQNAPFSGKNLTGEGNTPDQTTRPQYIFVHLLSFFGHCTYKSSNGKALVWSGKVMEIDLSKVVGNMCNVLCACVWNCCRMYGLFQTSFYFGYMALFSIALGIMCGN